MVILFGPAGAGKSMQGTLLTERYGWHWLSTGELFRQSTDPSVIATLKSGELISDEQTYKLLDDAVRQHATAANIILDGFPRTEAQTQWLLAYGAQNDLTIEAIIVLDVPADEIINRLSKRGRPEDAPDAIRRRMEIYQTALDKILATFAVGQLPVIHVDGVGDTSEVNDRIAQQLEVLGVA